MTCIYDQHRTAFANVGACVVLKNGELVARIALKFPRDGAGRLYAYVHWLGTPMVRGFAGGYGYDKRSAAVAAAVRKMTVNPTLDPLSPAMTAHVEFMRALDGDGGEYFDRKLELAGFTVIVAI